ncbi:Amino acid ABC transporter membrane protein 1, PAAT family [Hyphomicrobiales bacterium]|nr:Amino acid ABC transporter membrane protein 1, PAAT family [Hyphomicrobiales bacterium]CAH1691203.1 Amino acid ABC transporter membrane protein 1, PAAT family [Hyphomicrobiales bacterium]
MLMFRDVFAYSDMLLSGLLVSVCLCGLAGITGFVLAVACAELKRTVPGPASWSVSAYVETIRNTPFIVQLFFIYFGMASLGWRMLPEVAALIALSLNAGAYFTEIIRGGLMDGSRGIREAAVAQGMTSLQVYLRIVLPPALAKVDKPLVGQFVLIFLGSAVISQISVEDLTSAAQFVQTRTFRAFETYILVTAMYVSVGLLFSILYNRVRQALFPWLREVRR